MPPPSDVWVSTVQPWTPPKFADPACNGVVPGAPWANVASMPWAPAWMERPTGVTRIPRAERGLEPRVVIPRMRGVGATRAGRTRSRRLRGSGRAMVVSAPRSERHDVFIGISRAKKTFELRICCYVSISRHHRQQIYNYRPTSIYCANFSASNTSTSSVSSKSNSAASSSFTTA